MKVKVLRRDPADYVRETKRDIHKVARNFEPELHPFEANREYVRALNAAKLERVFAKPFLGALDGHRDGVTALAAHPALLSCAASAAADGQVRIWDLAARRCTAVLGGGHAADTMVRGVVFNPAGTRLISVGDDKRINFWDVSRIVDQTADGVSGGGASAPAEAAPDETISSKNIVSAISHHRYNESTFATCGEGSTLIWDSGRSHPVRELQWGVDSVHAVKFNPVETDVLASAASDRSVILYDVRARTPAVRKVVMDLRTNALAWNPMEAFVFVTASEDYNCYQFDSRQLRRPLNVHADHVGAVIDLAFAPTGREFVTGSYDKTVRIFPVESGHSREVYHTKRMQRLTCVSWSGDNRYILSGSDETNVRLWKARAWEKLGLLKERQKTALDYGEKLKEKYASHPKVKRIIKNRHVPKHVMNAKKEHATIRSSRKRKEANRRAHSKPGSVPHVAERDKHVLQEQE